MEQILATIAREPWLLIVISGILGGCTIACFGIVFGNKSKYLKATDVEQHLMYLDNQIQKLTERQLNEQQQLQTEFRQLKQEIQKSLPEANS